MASGMGIVSEDQLLDDGCLRCAHRLPRQVTAGRRAKTRRQPCSQAGGRVADRARVVRDVVHLVMAVLPSTSPMESATSETLATSGAALVHDGEVRSA